jgi:hypothetical protein
MLRLGLRCLRRGREEGGVADVVAAAVVGRRAAVVREVEAKWEDRLAGIGSRGVGELCGLVMEWEVGFGGLSDGGGLVLGLSVGGGSGIGVSMGSFDVGAGEDPFAGGGTGKRVWGNGKVEIDIDSGDGGGDGVVEVDKKVGPRGVDCSDDGESLARPVCVRSVG